MTDLTDESVKALLDGATPGAWAVNPKAATNVEAGRRGVAACGGYFDNTSDGAYAVENEANAHLIAAAPDLARALLDARAELAEGAEAAEAELATLRAQVERLTGALTIAANRLHRCSVDYDTGTREFIEVGEWADEARAALTEGAAP